MVVEVDTPSASDALALVDLHASVGTIRLHVPSDMEVRLFVFRPVRKKYLKMRLSCNLN